MLAILFCGGSRDLSAQITFAQTARPSINESRNQLTLDGKLLLDAEQDGFMSLLEIRRSPTGAHFLVIACGYECNDNIGFVFKSNGAGKRRITSRWDYILQSAAEWAEDGGRIYYYRVNSTGADAPKNAPAEGWVEFNLKTGRKSPATARRLKTNASYAVFNVRGDDVLNVRSKPNRESAIVGAIPHDASGIRVTGASVRSGREQWVPISYQNGAGWVNQNYLREESQSPHNQQTPKK